LSEPGIFASGSVTLNLYNRVRITVLRQREARTRELQTTNTTALVRLITFTTTAFRIPDAKDSEKILNRAEMARITAAPTLAWAVWWTDKTPPTVYTAFAAIPSA
jgi:hypothetical protein